MTKSNLVISKKQIRQALSWFELFSINKTYRNHSGGFCLIGGKSKENIVLL